MSYNNSINKATIVAEISVYNISNINLHIEAYQFKTVDYYNVMKSLIEAGKYRNHHFKKYVLWYNDVATTSRQIDYRLVVNSECVNYVLATFRPNNYGTIINTTIAIPINTLIAPCSTGSSYYR